ncbi:Cdc6/Cdc18 family protein [Staphylothermus hellenicus]|uniref:ORC1-type DNA replication protein n=1 Tax=Staphylothermus hellenicus (strain DSM 12710 / JCM 10830 / BK20S6-10-b1 / P8) TaxID=591019 RepID=D7DAF7_STAHD|nr:orc1/cdc6 family replication initiation protein [Staphylothermus hellenicus]ADI31154.1 orc1/cdc6 family replication initiation protein [Staphylothermus hellenicus DSM 12710]
MASDIIDEIIESRLKKKSRIFMNKEILHPDYIPETLPHREKEIRKLAEILVVALKGERPSNVLIYGLTGTGKTAVAKYVSRRLAEKASALNTRLLHAYVNTRKVDTTYRVIASIASSLGLRIPSTGIAISEVYRRYTRALENWGGLHIVVLDEIDYYVRREGDDLLYKLVRINEELEKARVAIVGITNDINFVENLDPRVRSSLGEEEIVFPPYDAEQLYDILKQRADKAFYPGVVSSKIISYCAALAAREHGDARRALDLLRVAGEIAEREGSSIVTIKHVKKAQIELEEGRVFQAVSTLPLHPKLVLKAIVELMKEKGTSTTGEVYNKYFKIALEYGIEPLTQRRISEIITQLDMIGLINAVVVSRGRHGKTKLIKINSGLLDVIEGAIKL